jgi:S1-C subfamily serine protease
MRAFLLTCLACLFAASTVSAWDLDQVRIRAEQNLVQVGNGCSGTIVSASKRLAFTAYHCIDDAIAVDSKPATDANGEVLLGPDGKPIIRKAKKLAQVPLHQFYWDEEGTKGEVTFYADIVARNAKLDVAILRIPEKVGPIAVSIGATTDVPLLAKGAKVPLGATVWHIGNPMMLYGTVTRGVMSSPRNLSDYGIDGVRFFVQYDGGILGGSSGGALYDDNGTYIGVISMADQSGTVGLAVPMSDVWTVAADACLASELGGENAKKCPDVAKKTPDLITPDMMVP